MAMGVLGVEVGRRMDRGMDRGVEEAILVCLDLRIFMMAKDMMIVIDNKIIGNY
jgi:hypothetical protein